MTPFTVIHGEGHGQMADAAELAFQYPAHGKMLGGLLLDIENIGVAIIAVEPLRMRPVRKNRGGNAVPFRFEQQRFDYCSFHPRFDRQIGCRGDHAFIHGLHPVDAVAEFRFRKIRKLRKLFFSVSPVPVVTFFTMRFLVAEYGLSVVAAGRAAISSVFVRRFRYLRRIDLQIELQFGMAHTAGIFQPVYPMGKNSGFHAMLPRSPADQNISMFVRGQ